MEFRQFRQTNQVVQPGGDILRCTAYMSFQGLLQAEVGEKQAMTGTISVHQVARNGHVFFGAAAPKGNLFIDINRQSASVPQFSLTYSFGILSIIQFHWRMSRFDLINPIEKRRCNMNVSQGIEQFFCYQRLNVKKKYIQE